MKTYLFALVGVLLLATAGCRTDPAIPILERQLRLQEDEIYRLRANLDSMHDGGPSCSERWVDGSRSDRGGQRATGPSREDRSEDRPSNGIKPQVEGLSNPTTTPPRSLVPPSGATPLGIPEVPQHLQGPSKPLPPPEEGPGGRSSRRSPERSTRPVPDETDGPVLERSTSGANSRSGSMMMASKLGSAVAFTPSGDSRRVATIVLNRTLTGGISAETGSADQGLLVVVEPRDREGRTVDAPAEMSVVVIDPALEGNASRVARWDFPAAETAALFRRAGSTAAIHLTTAWPADPPMHDKLQLFVRYVTADGRKLQADMPIEVALAGDKTTRWNRNDRPVQRDSASPPPRNEAPTARVPGPSPHTASRSEDAKPRRPVWSPERR
jgi:hypothetical protein